MNVAQFRKKPIVIEARQWEDGENTDEIFAWGDEYDVLMSVRDDPHGTTYLTIETLEGAMTATSGDWIIRGVQDEFYPCKPEIFDATYEAVPD
jgi:hypothetical protein